MCFRYGKVLLKRPFQRRDLGMDPDPRSGVTTKFRPLTSMLPLSCLVPLSTHLGVTECIVYAPAEGGVVRAKCSRCRFSPLSFFIHDHRLADAACLNSDNPGYLIC